MNPSEGRALIARAMADDLGQFTNAVFEVRFQFPMEDHGKTIVLKLVEVTEKNGKKTFTPIKDPKGEELSFTGILDISTKNSSILVLNMSEGQGLKKQVSFTEPGKPRVGFAPDDMTKRPEPFFLQLPDFRKRKMVLQTEFTADPIRKTTAKVTSPEFEVASHFILDDDNERTYGWDEGNSVRFYSNASEGEHGDDKDKDDDGNHGAFYDIHEAINNAKKFIFIADWSFQPYARIQHKKAGKDDTPDIQDTIGAILVKKAKAESEMVIAIHTWDHFEGPAPDPQNKAADKHLDAIATALNKSDKARPENLLFRRSSRTGVGFSHHQKYVIVDCEAENDLRPQTDENKDKPKRREIKVFYGGLDLTKGRFDWYAHPIMPDDPTSPELLNKFTEGDKTFDDWYCPEFKDDTNNVRQPWHDIHAQITGPTGRDFVREFIGRWNLDPSILGSKAGGNTKKEEAKKVNDVMPMIRDKDQFIQREEPREPKEGTPAFTGQVYRSIEKVHWGNHDAKGKQVQKEELKKVNDDADKAGEEAAKAKQALTVRGLVAEPLPQLDPDVMNLKKLEKEFDDKQKVVEGFPYFGTEGFVWHLGGEYESYEMSIQLAYLAAIKKAQRFIYIETQYLVGSGVGWGRKSVANKIPETIVKKITDKLAKGEDFHAYIVIPAFPEGAPTDGGYAVVRHYEWETMRYMAYTIKDYIAKNKDALGKVKKGDAKWQDYLSFYFPARWDGVKELTIVANSRAEKVKANRRYMIYVHSKLMIVDDFFLMLGSANLNERSLAGNRDTEICCGVTPENQEAADAVMKFRKKLWAELLGNKDGRAKPTKDWDTPESPACVQAIRKQTNANHRAFRAGKWKDEGFLLRYEFDLDGVGGLRYSTTVKAEDDILPPEDGKTTWDTVPDGLSDGVHVIVTPELKWNAGWGWGSGKAMVANLMDAGE